MSKPNKPSRHRPKKVPYPPIIPPHEEMGVDEEEIEDQLDDYELVEQERERGGEEYDPNGVFEEEEKKKPKGVLDINKLPNQQRVTYLSNYKRLLFLKALAKDPYQDVPKLAKEKCKMKDTAEGEKCITTMLGMISLTEHDPDYPARLLNYFNKILPENYPNRPVLDEDDVNELTILFKVVEEKLLNMAKITDPDTLWGKDTVIDAETIKESSAQKKVSMSDNFSNQPDMGIPVENGQVYPNNNQSRNTKEYYINRYPIADIGLMEMALRNIPNPRPNSIQNFVDNFTDLYNDWMHNPMKMVDQLKFYFGPTHGEHAYRLWRDYREKHMQEQGYQQVPESNMSYGSGGGGFSQYGGYPGGMQPMQMSPEIEAERMADRRMDKMMKVLQLKMMDNAMQSQTPMPQGGQPYEEIYDQNGKVIKRIMLSPNGVMNGSSGNPMESAVFQGMMNMMQEIVRGKNNEMLEVMKSQNQPNNLLTDFAKTMMGNYMNQSNPISQIKEMLDITNLVKSQAPQSDGQKSLDQTRLEIDSKLAMHELDLKKMEMQHNWRMDENQTREQDSNVDKWLNTLQGMGESIIKPVAIKFLEGFGKGQMPGGPLGGMFPGATPQAQAQNPYNMSEQEYAMRQQQYYEEQKRQQEQPLRPMQPNPQRQYNPNPQQQMQQQYPPQQQYQPMQQPTKPIQAASEREIQDELSRLSPQQLQEIEDKMLIDDMNREKVKNAIRAFKNGRRFQKPQEPAQVKEAQNVLFNQQGLNEDDLDLGEEDDYDVNGENEQEDDYEVPIASGKPKVAPEQLPKKKFSDYEVRSTTEIAKTKKLSPQQKAMLSSGQMTPAELAQIEDAGQEEIDDYSSDGVPMPAGLRNASEDALVEQNLKKTKQSPKKQKKKSEVIDKVDEQQGQKEVDEAEKILAEAEVIPEDQFE